MVGCSFLIAHWSVGWVNSPYKAYDVQLHSTFGHLDIWTIWNWRRNIDNALFSDCSMSTGMSNRICVIRNSGTSLCSLDIEHC